MTIESATDYLLSLGSNLGDRTLHLQKAIAGIEGLVGTAVLSCSDVYETDPVGFLEQPAFLNLAVSIRSVLSPKELLVSLLGIETAMGRVRDIRYGPRIIDVDILLCGTEVVADPPLLIIPHPRMHERAFVLTPLAQIAPDAVHPQLGATVSMMLETVAGREGVRWHSTLFQNDCERTES
ncbi:MAG: 2-amino-4-hydroxy-6-hydroxymethyldihydropteridine diphosphokinase [Firmicutes bacterium]|nr:2-amino-4-hydroxy-6-hydroxymethyldihydropteridine diphosphokinase [Bacillota bacterium]